MLVCFHGLEIACHIKDHKKNLPAARIHMNFYLHKTILDGVITIFDI
jgi:hypothetical protein